jgi:hypothetical protein
MSIRSTILLCGFARLLEGQPASQTSEPIIDVHVHADRSLDNLRRLERHSVVFAVLTSGAREDIWRKWVDSSQIEFVPALLFPNRFRTLAQAESAYADPGIFLADSSNRQAMFVFPDTAWLRSRLMAKTFLALGEMTSQYWGLAPTDPRLEAYFALAEEFDVPIGIHMALAPPDETTRRPTFRARFGNPLLLEDALVRHPKLRLYVMHAGYPFLEEMIALITSILPCMSTFRRSTLLTSCRVLTFTVTSRGLSRQDSQSVLCSARTSRMSLKKLWRPLQRRHFSRPNSGEIFCTIMRPRFSNSARIGC